MIDETLWRHLHERSRILDSWEIPERTPLTRRQRLRGRILRSAADHIWQPLHDLSIRHGAYCDDWD